MIAQDVINSAFGSSLLYLGERNKNVVVIDIGTGKKLKTEQFKKWYSKRYFNFGLAEQNAVGVAAGMAIRGKTVFLCSLSSYLPSRALNQIRNLLCVPNLNVKLVCSHAGLAVGEDGALFQAIEDISLMRSLPNMKIFSPADAVECKKMMREMVNVFGPSYIRLASFDAPSLYEEDYVFEVGKADVLREYGSDIVLIATGSVVSNSCRAVDSLNEKGIKASLINMSSIKPLDKELLMRFADKAKFVFTVEDHNVIGGLGSAVSEVLSQLCPRRVISLGIQDHYGQSGSASDLYAKYWLDEKGICEQVRRFVGI